MPLPLAPPAGMRDLLPPEAESRAALSADLIRLFGQAGYRLVTTPAFEHAEVIDRGLDLDRRDLMRFVEPETGEVALLRPDITPQIARIVATQLATLPAPFRLSYAGSVIRRRRGRARRQRQIAQAGVECIGIEGLEADAEVIALAAVALRAAGLHEFRIELRLTPFARSLLAQVPSDARVAAEAALIRKDRRALSRVLHDAHCEKKLRVDLEQLTQMYGDMSVLQDAPRRFSKALRPLRRLVEMLEGRGLSRHLALDLGEVRGFGYYTGPSFVVLAEGPGEPLGAGGRYDELLGRFGRPLAATGCGLDLENVSWARRAQYPDEAASSGLRVVVAGRIAAERESLAVRLRARNIDAAVLPWASRRLALDYAEAWRYHAAVLCDEKPLWIRVSDRAERRGGSYASLRAWAARSNRSLGEQG